jgi:hypothetical protein
MKSDFVLIRIAVESFYNSFFMIYTCVCVCVVVVEGSCYRLFHRSFVDTVGAVFILPQSYLRRRYTTAEGVQYSLHLFPSTLARWPPRMS